MSEDELLTGPLEPTDELYAAAKIRRDQVVPGLLSPIRGVFI